ncbi:MAG: hypothetical protein M1351_02245 [Candidatus Thermoplasmatota archaeon]|nr:hypothetical protein [Candidatus Thermoplasmatota archaeon]
MSSTAPQKTGISPKKSVRVHVLAIQRIRDVIDGSPKYQVQFGIVVNLDGELKNRLAASGQSIPPGSQEIAVNSLILVTSFDKIPPYRINSEWDLVVSDNGSVSLEEVFQ